MKYSRCKCGKLIADSEKCKLCRRKDGQEKGRKPLQNLRRHRDYAGFSIIDRW